MHKTMTALASAAACAALLSCAAGPRMHNPQVYESEAAIIRHQGESPEELAAIAEGLRAARETAEAYFGRPFPRRVLYVYKDQREFQGQKHRLLSLFVHPDWYIGDNIGETALIVSPATAVRGHSRESILAAIPHEYVHTVVHSINPDCPLWINEGAALYLTNGRGRKIDPENDLPPIKIFTSRNSLYFAKHGGYSYAQTFIEYVEARWGREKAVELVERGDMEAVLGLPLQAAYDGWAAYLRERAGG